MPKYSQNFLTDNNVAAEIADTCSSYEFDRLIEIGPGKGFLTRRLSDKFGNGFTAIEIDGEMVGKLKRNISDANLPEIINEDFLKLDLEKLSKYKKVFFVGNLPYACAAPILQKVLAFENFAGAVFMFQKEVADRITATPGSKKYGILSLSVQTKASAKTIIEVGKKCFNPVPKVDSAVVEFAKLNTHFFVNKEQELKFMNIVKGAFAHRRKTVLNSLSKSLSIAKDELELILTDCGIDPNTRPEKISADEYLKLSDTLQK